jgi:hypothetical protein
MRVKKIIKSGALGMKNHILRLSGNKNWKSIKIICRIDGIFNT